MTLLICKRLVLVEVSVTTRRANAFVLQDMLGLPVREQNAKMIVAVEEHVCQCGILQIPHAIMSHCNTRINFGMQTNYMAATVT
mmetsp:Transcript_13820/g.22646  ORF Transcript_13820/g.22646 Transcript_13820/m.22646 type:complete len:84 (+) Transcript_13820:846-1097(+)